MKSELGNFLCVIVTGMSGAGKSQAIKCLEDFGFYCIYNLPAPLLPNFADLMVRTGSSMQKVVLGLDVRDGRYLENMSQSIQDLKNRGIEPWLLFFDADDATLLKRYSETRRKHPMGRGVLEGIKVERRRLRDVRAIANRIIGTSNMTLSELKEMVASSLPTSVKSILQVTVYSFGYKYGVPVDADMVWDVRFLPNPNYVPSLHHRTGLTSAVKKYVLRSPMSKRFYKKFLSLVAECLPNYIKEGKSHLSIAIGCTGGRHRSVTIAEGLVSFLRKKGYPVFVNHRDIQLRNPLELKQIT